MQSYEKRFNGNKEELLRDVRRYTAFGAMRKHGIKDYVSFRKWLTEITGDENFGLNPTIGALGGTGNNTVLEQFVQAFKDCVARMEADSRAKDERIAQLERIIECYKRGEITTLEESLVPLLEKCRELR